MNTCTIFNGAFPIWGNAMASIAGANCPCRTAVGSSRERIGSLQRLTSNALEQSRPAMAAAKNLDWTGNAATLCARALDRDTRLAASIDDRVRQTGQLAWSGGSS